MYDFVKDHLLSSRVNKAHGLSNGKDIISGRYESGKCTLTSCSPMLYRRNDTMVIMILYPKKPKILLCAPI